MPSLNQHVMSRRGFCLCCMAATTLAANLTSRVRGTNFAVDWFGIGSGQAGEVVFEGCLVDDDVDQRIKPPDHTRAGSRGEHG